MLRHQSCLTPLAAAAAAAAATLFVVMKLERVLARAGGWWELEEELSFPTGDKGDACQRPHSSELTHITMHVTHTYMRTFYLPLTVFSLLHPIPFPAFMVFVLMPLS